MRISLNRLKQRRSRGIKYRQLLAVLLCMCMGLTTCLDIQAVQRDTVNPRLLSDHSHAVCGGKSGCTLCADGEHSQITYTAVYDAEEFVQAAKDGGNYYLADDIEIIGGGDEIYGTSKAVVNIENDFNLCLNGHTCSIKIVSDKGTSYYAMLLKGAANFNLCDCSEGKTGKLINNSFEEGKGNQNAPHVIFSQGSGDITMYGGTVSNNNNSWVLNCFQSTGKQIVDGAVFEGSYVLSGKTIIVKSGTVGSSGGAGNVITGSNITVEGGTVNGFVQVNSSGVGKFTGGVVNGYLSLGSNTVSEVGNITINALRNQYLGGINATNSNVKVYLYDSPTFTGMAKNREIYCKASDTAEGATIIPHSRDNSKNYIGTGVITILLQSSSAQLGQYVMQDLPSADYLNKFKLPNTVDFVLRLADMDKNLKLDRIININTTNFPDASFRNFISESYDDDNDGKLYESDVSTVETMDVSNKGITNLKGIEYFTGITSLNCSKNQLAALDLSKNIKLNTLDASANVVSIGSCAEYDLTALPGMNTEKVSSVNGAALSDGKLTGFTGTGKITYTYDVGNSGVDKPQFSLKYDVQEHQHQYGKWTLTKEPTETAEGTAERTCSECTEKEIKNDVPNLKDPIWKKGDYVAPTRDDEGSQSYTSTYGTVKVVIPALGITEEEKVAEVKKVVEEALAGITATNNTTRKDIQSVIDNALTEAGISNGDVTVTVGDIDKTDATTVEDGKIGGSVSIVSKKDENVKDSVPINKTIIKLPKTEEEKVAEAKKVVEEALAGITATNNTTREDIQSVIDNALTEAGISSEDVTVTVGDIDKTDATTVEDGKIGGSVSIVSKKDENVKDSVPVNKTITKLPKTEEEKVAEAKKVVEEALAGITATNNTTREDIQSVIDNALTEAGISSEDVTVTVGDIDKTDATTSEDGKIGGSVSIVSKKDENVKDSVPVNKTIIKLPKTEEEKVAEAKKVVEEALAGITAANDTTREDIQSVIDNALTEAGISSEDVTVTVGDIDKTDATTSEDGKIGGSVSIVSKKDENVKDNVPISKIITRLSGNISKDVEKGENAPDTVLVSSEKELADILLTAEEKELVGSGTDIKFVLDVKNAEDTVSSGDKEAVQSALNGYEKGQYLDIALFKVVGQNRSAISETAKKITITLAIPDRLKNTDGRKTRKYAVIRVHNGIADILTDMDDNDDTVTIMTDRFSAYAIVYKDEGGNNNNNSNAGDNNGNTVGNTDTGDSNNTGDNKNTGANSLTEKEKQEKRELVLNGKLKASQTGSQINITWGKVSGADGYDVYVQYCGMKFNAKSLNQIKSGKNVKITVKKVNGKKLNLKKNYKIYIRAYKMSGGKKKTLAKTIIAHIVGKNNKKYTNVKAIKIKKSSYRLKVGKTARIKAKTVLVNKNKKQLSNAHAKQFRYATSDKKVAVVSKRGKIRAVGTGSCIIYVYARNGYAKKVKVTVSN